MRWAERNLGKHGRSLLACAVIAGGLTAASLSPSQADGFDLPASALRQVSTPTPSSGLATAVRTELPRLISTRTEALQAGVVGVNRLDDTFPTTDISVAAIAEIGNTIYVGGKFTQVEIAATRQRINQPFLAAFDRTTGAWIPTFRPAIDGNVWDLKTTEDGRLIVAGQFTNVNSVANTTGVAMINAATGAVDPTWRVTLGLTGAPRRPIARTLDIDDGKLYIGGNFTRITGSDNRTSEVIQAARVDLGTGNFDTSFRPNFDGIVFDIDADAGRVYVVGDFLYVNSSWSIGQAVLHASNGSLVSGLQPWVRTDLSSTSFSYQQAILALDDQIWQSGSQHSRQVYRPSDYSLLRSWVSSPLGDGQALAVLDGVVYSGSHANGRLYQDAYRAAGLVGATSSKPARWMTAFSTLRVEHMDWYPDIGSEFGEGSWELFADSTGCLWTGGDFNRGSVVGGTARYVQGFAKFC